MKEESKPEVDSKKGKKKEAVAKTEETKEKNNDNQSENKEDKPTASKYSYSILISNKNNMILINRLKLK